MDAVAIHTSDPPQGEDAITSAMKICRICLLDNLMMRDLFAENEVASLSVKAMSFANVKMLPGDGLPTQVCCMCADKLESAYEFKLQVEQADNVLREKLVGGIIKDELFLNEVEIHLDAEKNNGLEEMNDSADYESTDTLPVETETDKNFLKNQLIILEAEKLAETDGIQQDSEQDNLQESIEEELQQELASSEDMSDAIDESRDEVSSNKNIIRSCTDTIPTDEHNYIMQQQCIILHTEQFFHKKMQETVSEFKHEITKYEESLSEQNQENQYKIKKINTDDNDGDNNSDFESGLDWPVDSHECTTCKKQYSTKKSLLRHQLLHEEPNFECDICSIKFYRKDKLKAHYDKCAEKNPDQVRKCNICGDSFENNEILREHRAKHVTEGILTEEDLRDTEPKSEEKRLNDKMTRKRRTDIVGLECTECNKQYTSRKGLLRHIQVHEGKKYLCEICPKKFYRREHLKIHVAKHNMIKPYKCTRCSKRFIKEEQLNNHLPKHDRTFKKNKETDSSKRFLCEICSKSFTQSTTLLAHLRAHKGIKPYVCEVCSRPFTTNAYLKMHMRTHTQERPYICQYCSRAFARADTLANHLTSHTGEAKYHCKCCPKNFRRLKSLKEHMFIHTGQRPYECPTCDRKFNNNGSRYAHSKRCKQNLLQNQNRAQQVIQQTQQQQQQQQLQHQHQHQPQQVQIQMQPEPHPVRLHQTTIGQAQVIKAQNIKTIAIARQAEPTVTTQHQVMQHQEILMPLILPLTVTLADVGEEVILPEGTKIFTTS
ncbi:Zinc finger protein 112-like protein [Acromyrmex echinatior]|uniref:Zinc finger protein 112-like protein n=1 Tax=Acromyrmex echinatior TaxID=103372 RepID=F4WDK1_ACREC|nr:Zinc finger protein 112-like protein [Acromyrmex echinatior]